MHEDGKCGQNENMKCCNCGGEHSAAFGGRPVQMQAKEVQKYKILNQVSYAEAVKKVKENDKVTPREALMNEAGNRQLPVVLPPVPSQSNRVKSMH